ncbi:MAG TPA: O-antigen ligase family protein [Aggregatilineales bacterium]|nr:O-antigen ligase family protein [Aggregatilineales bacterium]
MTRRSDLRPRAVVAVLVTYAVFGGATYSGMLNPRYQAVSLALTAILVVGWLAIRWRGHWTWHRTALDPIVPLWLLVIALSLLSNPDALRRTGISLWYLSAYVGLWYIIQDALANHALRRETLVEGLLIGGGIAIVVGMVQLWGWFGGWWPAHDVVPFSPPRVASTLDNPNFLASGLIVVLPLALAAAIAYPHRFLRLFLGFYLVCGALLLAVGGSRGGWVGALAALVTFGILVLAQYDLLNYARLRAWWSRRSLAVRGVTVIAVAAGLGGVLIMARAIVLSLNIGGRGTDLRTYLYSAAITLFREKPITGSGLFTFGRGLLRLASTPPLAAHAHAHDLPLNIAAELGLPGLLAFAATLGLFAIAMRRYWRTLGEAQQILASGGIAALVGVLVHHLFDMTGTAAVIALGVLLLLALTLPPPTEPAPAIARRIMPAGVTALWIVLIGAGAWNNRLYEGYYAAMNDGIATGNYAAAVERLQTVIDADPAPIYVMEQGFLLGTLASSGDVAAARRAQADFEQFCASEPTYAPAWANLAGVRWQLGDRAGAIQAMQRAVSLSPEAWMLPYNLGVYLEAYGQTDAARQAFLGALKVAPDIHLYTDWNASPVRRNLALNAEDLSLPGQTMHLLRAGKVDEARTLWAHGGSDWELSAEGMAIETILAVYHGDRSAAADRLAAAAKLGGDPTSDAWVHLAGAEYARAFGQPDSYAAEVAAVRGYIEQAPSAAVDGSFATIASAQFYTVGLSQFFIPQIYAPSVDPIVSMWYNFLQSQVP